MNEKRKKISLAEKRKKFLEQLEKVDKEWEEKKKRVLAVVFNDLLEDENIYEILNTNGRKREFKDKINGKLKEIIPIINQGIKEKEEVDDERAEGRETKAN